MRGKKEHPFFSGLIYEARAPLVWRYVELRPDEKEIVAANTANEQLLRLITSLSEKPQEQADDELHAELERIDLKITVLLDMASSIIRDQLNLPAAEPIRMDAQGVEWETSQPPEPGRLLEVKVYIDPELPTPLELYGMAKLEKPEHDVKTAVCARMRFVKMGQSVSDELEKFIFRQHRKEVALQRYALTNKPR